MGVELGVPMTELARIPRAARGALFRGRRPSPHQRYMAFLSYSHDDEKDAAWLHESLEEFRVPKRLIGQLTDMGPVPKRLAPIFRDRHELAVAADLGEEIEEAIAGSRFLIVLCSPSAAQSHWINEEIMCFKRLHREDRVLAVILDGEPFASDIPGREHEECFPPALKVHCDRKGRPTAQRAEPLAADLRESGDGRHMGLLKTAAGMLGVGLDDLAQREAHRRQRRMTIITAASLAGMLATSGLAYTAIEARDEARDQRREADKLVGFMLGDLRAKLEPLGRLDVLDSVGARALAYYEGQNKADLSDGALAQRSKALTLMGEMAQTRGDLPGALARYREAMEGTAEAVRRSPDNPQRLFDHAQNVFWVGYIDYQRGEMDRAGAAFREYRRLSDRMVALAPNKPEYRLERIYADTNLGTVLMDQRRYREAAEVFQQSLEPAETLAARYPGNLVYQKQLSSALAWLSEAREYSGQLDEALAHRRRQLASLAVLLRQNKDDTDLMNKEMIAHRSVARLLASRGDLTAAREESAKASAALNSLSKIEPANTEWMQWGAFINLERAGLELALDRPGEAAAIADAACGTSRKLAARDRSVSAWRIGLQLSCLEMQARIALKTGAKERALGLSQQALALARTDKAPVDRGISVTKAEMMLGNALKATGQDEAARGAYERAFAAWPANMQQRPSEIADRAMLLGRLGRRAEAEEARKRLSAMGYRYPDYRMH